MTILSSVFLHLVVKMVSVCLHTHMYSNYFMEICDYIDTRLSRSFLKVTFDSFSSLQLTTGLVVNCLVITSPTLAGEHILLIPW